jgi:hypothetical protein
VRADGHSDVATEFLRRWNALPNKQRYQLAPEVPISDMQVAARTHPDPWVRRSCLGFLDHYASDASTRTFLAALDDPVTFVREVALHGLACERCRAAELCVADVVPILSGVLATDSSPEVRHKVVPILLRLSDRDPRARAALERAAVSDDDLLIRKAACAALRGQVRDASRSRHDLGRSSKTRKGKATRVHRIPNPVAPKARRPT